MRTQPSAGVSGLQAAARPRKFRAVLRKVLVVEDDIDSVRSMALLFGAMGHVVDYAINGTAAVELATRFKPDIVIVDLLLPDGHGADVCRRIRLNPELRHTRIYGVTGSSRVQDHHLARVAGCADVLLKPVSPDVYERILGGGATRGKRRD